MPKCEICKEWFVGEGNICMWCKLRKEVKERIALIKGKV